jgi:hypothetical protein
MKVRLPLLALICSVGLCGTLVAQAPKAGDKGGEKKAPAPKTPADLAYDAFNKTRNEPGGKMDAPRFQRVIASGIAYLTEYPTHGRVNEVITNLAFFSSNIDKKQPALRTSYASSLKLEVTNYRYKEGVSEPAKVVLTALDAAIADSDARELPNPDNVTTLREKIDALAQTPGGARFLVERERSYAHVLFVSSPNAARSEAHLKKLLEHTEKPVVAMAREELNVLEARKTPFELKVAALDGKEIDLAQLRGKVVGMYIWSSANKQSTDRFEDLKRIYGEYRKRGFEIVTVSYDKEEDRAKLEKYVKDNRIAWPIYYDGKGAKNDFAPKINANGVPRLFVFDQKGILQVTLAGGPVARVTADFPQNQLEGRVKQLLGIK